jgi:hypothetical protein
MMVWFILGTPQAFCEDREFAKVSGNSRTHWRDKKSVNPRERADCAAILLKQGLNRPHAAMGFDIPYWT